jgi:hypothetical protein
MGDVVLQRWERVTEVEELRTFFGVVDAGGVTADAQRLA